eukprot:CAMPEP_0184450382 /NCGR_PEP_ID=MMETSP0740-20130409/5712_1 /TAXON_ID=385413 /ORGANISM="Thalassiosira miniscula, Strain CCMP1093" /LENGTH=55 /DNA_ID=CAMNT_0026820655 /DNA_START=60 /DNA_END=227 /DNA_ORIENTATION=+
MSYRGLRRLAVLVGLSVLLGCSGPGYYPLGGDAAAPSDPVRSMSATAGFMNHPGI